MRIVIAASEAVPFFKTGGLADVTTALAAALAARGHEVVLMIPDYAPLRRVRQSTLPVVADAGLRFSIAMHGRHVPGAVNWTMLPGTDVRVLLVSQPDYFDRRQLYQEHGAAYHDNCERFCFFSRAVPEICQQMVLRPDVIHCNDWQTGLIPGLLNTQFAARHGFDATASVMTIHNMAFQGRFWHFDMQLTGMEWKYFTYHHMEAWGDLNLLKCGLAFADQITTVSPTYAHEVCSPDGGYGLEGLLRFRRNDLSGILNGIDVNEWNPATDPHLPRNYNVETVAEGKAACKAVLQERAGLPVRPDVPLFGMVSRMTDQKGFDLIMGCADRLMAQDLQLVFLGTGEASYEARLRDLAMIHPDRVAVTIGFDEGLAHLIEAGSDMFLMPSRFEPCGLNQMYSQQYGTIPVVRKVGGLADSVIDLNAEGNAPGNATGFVFAHYTPHALSDTIDRALAAYRQPSVRNQLIRNGMTTDWSWSRSAAGYEDVYRTALSRIASRPADGRN